MNLRPCIQAFPVILPVSFKFEYVSDPSFEDPAAVAENCQWARILTKLLNPHCSEV
jgi:hypothetical protein